MRGRHFLAAGAVTLTCLIGAPAAAAEPVTAPSCSSTVEGTPGQSVLLDPASVSEPVTRALAGLDPLGLLTPAFRKAWAGTAPIPLGTVPEGGAEITGSQISQAVIGRLGEIPLLGPVLQPLTSAVRGTLASLCAIVIRVEHPAPPATAKPPAPAPVTPGAGATESPATGKGFTSNEGAGTPSVSAGAVFGSRLADLIPGPALYPMMAIGAPGSPANPPLVVVPAPQTAGSAEALPAKDDGLSPVVLTALVVLTLVSAQLVRRWVLNPRR
ncbi:hypothetical protein [Amycolatopsis sp. GM8]|uniref:hypothetical protein n=1 Tax=Amycolatopsis sp. GM8 TaxID=2896530 RepID=UPI001F31005D|nr:hypothetical protein [Amycolatopsis sp. GM8]